MRVADVMTKPAISVAPTEPLSDAIASMVRGKISGLPVVDDGVVVGVLSESDLLRRVELGTTCGCGFWARLFNGDLEAECYRRFNGRLVRDVMTEKPVTVEATDTLSDAARLMRTFKVKRLPVVDEGRLIGMLTRGDFMKALGRALAPTYEDTTHPDGEIVAKICNEIVHQRWAATSDLRISSNNGAVVIRGTAASEAQRRALIVAAEVIDGVRSVETDIEVLESVPMIGL